MHHLVRPGVRKPTRHDPEEEERDEVREDGEVEEAEPARLEQEHLAADDPGEHDDPQAEHPPVQEREDPDRDEDDQDRLAELEALARLDERLPDEEEAQVGHHQAARPEVLDAPRRREMEADEHGEHEPSPAPRPLLLRLIECALSHALCKLRPLASRRPGP